MHRRQPLQFARLLKPNAVSLRLIHVACGLALLSIIGGCNSLGNSRLVKELQTENERLLTEFRGQRDRAAELENANRLQAERLAESEKLLARLSQSAGTGRLSSLPPTGLPQSSLPKAGVGGSPAGLLPAQLPGNSSAASPPGTPASELRWQPRYDSRP